MPEFQSEPVTAAQLRAARAMLGWSLLEAARLCGQSVSTVRMSEDPAHAAKVSARVVAIRRAYEAAGISFLPADQSGTGVRLADDNG